MTKMTEFALENDRLDRNDRIDKNDNDDFFPYCSLYTLSKKLSIPVTLFALIRLYISFLF